MTSFTTRNPGLPPTRNKPGKLGASAGAAGARTPTSQGGHQGSSSGRGGVTSPSRLTAGGGAARPAPHTPEPEQSDFKHAIVAAQYQNMRGLGREIPFGVYLIRNGHYREIAPKPFDLFLDA